MVRNLPLLVLIFFGGCATSSAAVDPCREERAALHIVYSTHDQIWAEPVILCPGDKVRL